MKTVAQAPIRSRSAEESGCRISWLDLLLPLALMAVCFFVGLGALGLTGPDEPRYAAVARNMARTGDWVTPRLGGGPWLEKPALYYWLAGFAFRVFGDGEFAMRLPSALAAVLATLAAAWAALRAYGADAARLTLLMLPVTIGLISLSHSAAFDMLFAGLLAAAAAAAAEMLQKPRAGGTSMIAFGFMLGAATLAKGPAAILLAGCATLLWALISRQITAAFRFFHPICVAAFALTAVPWYALCAARNPGFLRVFFLEHNVERYLTPLFQHAQPVWFFGPVLLAAIVPWTVLLLPLLFDAFQARKAGQWRDSPTLFFACWAITPVIFFTFSESKLPGYILPSVPPLILILAATLARRLSQDGVYSRKWTALVGCTLPMLALAGSRWVKQLPADSGLATANAWMSLLALAAVGGLACVALAWTRRERAAIAGVAIVMAVLVVGADMSVLPRLDPYVSARAAARITAKEGGAADRIFILGEDRSLQLGLEYYLDRSVPQLPSPAPVPAWTWTTAKLAAQLQQQGFRYTIIGKVSESAWLLRIEQLPGW